MGSFRFQTRLTIVYLALFLVVLGGVLLAFNRSMPQNVRAQVQQQLGASARVFERIIDSRVEQLGASAELLARDFGFRDAIATQDQPTIMSALRNQRGRIGADIAFVLDLDEDVIAVIGGQEGQQPSLAIPEDMKERAEELGVAARVMPLGDRLYELVLVPVMAPVPIAWIAFGIELDADAANEIKALSPIALDIAFLTRKGDEAFQIATATDAEMALGTFLSEQAKGTEAAFTAAFNGHDYMFWRVPLDQATGPEGEVAILIYYSLDVAMQPYRSLVTILYVVTGAGLVLLIVGSVLVSRGVTQPLRRLAEAAHDIAEGDYIEVSAPTRDAELTDLTNSFNRMVSAVREREEHIRFQANHDIETGLPNRLLFELALQARISDGAPFVMVVIEVQQLTELRSVLNHSNVNDLMAAIGERVGQVTESAVARLSTETFGVTLGDAREADIIASMLMNLFLTPFNIADIVVDASIRMGLVKFPADGEDFATLLRHAHAALDRGRSARGGYAWYDPESDSSQKRRLSLMSELRDGIEKGEVRFAFQPKLDLKLGKVTAVEALVRWISPTHGFVPPDEFIPLAEQTGDVRHLTEWGLKEAVRQCADWRGRGIDLTVAVNLSTSDLMNQNLPGQVLTLLRDHNLPAEKLKLEVTESAVMHDMSRALDVLNMLAAMGVKLSIDDYGTGYSSLSYIKKLPVNEIKIDKTFVLSLAENDEDNILVRSTIELGHNLGLSVTAEGVEDEASLQRLRDYGCDLVQGYFICKPIPPDDLEEFLEHSPYGF